MSVLIKGMDMPEMLPDLTLPSADTTYDCMITVNRSGNVLLFFRGKSFPIVSIPTPHGRLIDADRLIAVMESVAGTQERMIPLSAVLELIKNSKTLIEAEEALKEREKE